MSRSGEGVTYAWLQGVSEEHYQARQNGFGGDAHPDTIEGLDNELWAVDANGSTELQYAMALGYAPTVSEALQLVTSPAYEGAGVLAVAESVEASEVFAGNAVPHIGRYEDDVAIETVEVSHPALTDVEAA